MELLPWLQQIDQNHWYTNNGPLFRQFEQGLWKAFFSAFEIESRNLCVCANGTAALELALRSLDLKAGSRVLVPALTFPATALAVLNVNLEPVFCDVDPINWSLTPSIALQTLSHVRADAVMPVAALGAPLNPDEWDRFQEQTGLPVVIDAAASLGYQVPAKRCTTCYSLHATKRFGIGEGGVIIAASAEQSARLAAMLNFGFQDGLIQQQGTNAKLSEYHAAVGMAQLQRIASLQKAMDQVRQRYLVGLSRLTDEFTLQRAHACGGLDWPNRVYSDAELHFWGAAGVVCLHHSAQEVMAALDAAGIQTRRWYTPSLDQHPLFRAVRKVGPKGERQLRVTKYLADHLLGLPMHSSLSVHDIDLVVATLGCASGRVAQPNQWGTHERRKRSL
jgi:dTDP-4-amino-4,6-dideoxygalactose transaminase